MINYSDKLRSPQWQKKRLQILNRDKFTCKLCKDTETELHVHHKFYEKGKQPWEYPDNVFVTLCKHCHVAVESIVKENGEVFFDYLEIVKVNTLQNKDVLLFIRYCDTVIMRFYNSKNDLLVAYQLISSVKSVSKLFKKAERF